MSLETAVRRVPNPFFDSCATPGILGGSLVLLACHFTMLPQRLKLVRNAAHDRDLSQAQRTFNRQIRQIDKLRDRLADWDKLTAAYQDKYTRELLPLLARSLDLQALLVHALHRGRDQKGLGTRERTKLAELIVELADNVLAERDDAAIKEIYNTHSDVDYDSKEAAQRQNVREFLEDMFDLDLGETDFESTDEVFRRAKEQFQERQSLHEAEALSGEPARTPRKKTARQLQKEAQAAVDAQRINQTIREIYRKLASALHPDRESDPHERARKTELMQRINQAYAKNNLLQLLELQLELEHIGEDIVTSLDDERLRHYNAVLKEQIAELKQELAHMHSAFCARFGLDPFTGTKPETLMRDLSRQIFSAQQDNRVLEQDLAVLGQPQGAKRWLKNFHARAREGDLFPFLG